MSQAMITKRIIIPHRQPRNVNRDSFFPLSLTFSMEIFTTMKIIKRIRIIHHIFPTIIME